MDSRLEGSLKFDVNASLFFNKDYYKAEIDR